MSVLRKVKVNELQNVNKWLESFLPDSWSIFNLTRSILQGRWTGQTFYTLGWPDIRCVVTGELEADHPCPDAYADCNYGFMYAPEDEDVDHLLNHEQVINWSKNFAWKGIPSNIALKIKSMFEARGSHGHLVCTFVGTFQARPKDIPYWPVPEGFIIRPVKPDAEIDYCTSTWKFRKPNTEQFMRSLVRRFPSACIADGQDDCMSFELVSEYGSIGFLHTREDARGKGLAKAVMSHLAKEFVKLNWDVYANVEAGNEASAAFHESMGMKCVGQSCFLHYRSED